MITRSPSFAAKWLSALLALLLVLGQFTFYPHKAAAADNLSWTALNNPPLGSGQQINDVLYGGGRFVAVSQGLNNRQIVTSVDGVRWTNTTNDLTTEAMVAVAYGGGVYIAVGNGGVISRSTDGVNWSKVAPSPTSNSLTMVKYLNNKFWAVGVSGTVMSSADGLTWNVGVYPDVTATNTIIDIDYKDGKYAVGDSNGKVYFSTTGGTGSWGSGTSLAPAQIQINYLANLNGIWFAIDANGKVYKSTDGSNWSSFTLAKQVFGATYGNGTYVIYSQSGGSVFTSTDASNWTEVSLPSGATWYGMTYGNGAFILVGNNGYILRSTDGANWTTVDPFVNRAIYNNGLYVAVGNNSPSGTIFGTILSSTDGMAWTNRLTTAGNLTSVAYGNNRYAAVGTGGKIYTSADGISWASVTPTNTTENLAGIRYVNGKFMAVGANGTLVVSTDGTTWTAPGSTGLSGSLTSVAYGNGKYLISGNASSLWYSSDGATWEKTTAGSSGTIAYNDVIYAGNKFVAAGGSVNIYTSPDGVIWTQRKSGTGTINGLAYENGMYVAVGTGGMIYSSTDGETWTAETSNVSSILRSVHYDGSRFYAIGAYLGMTTAAYGVNSSVVLQTAVADGAAATTTSTKIDLTFDADVAGLTDADITLTNGTGAAVKGALTGSGKNWSIALSSVTTEGDVSVAVASPSGYTIGGSQKTVAVYKATEPSSGGNHGSLLFDVQSGRALSSGMLGGYNASKSKGAVAVVDSNALGFDNLARQIYSFDGKIYGIFATPDNKPGGYFGSFDGTSITYYGSSRLTETEQIVETGGYLYFATVDQDSQNRGLYRFDQASGAVELLTAPGHGPQYGLPLAVYNGGVYFFPAGDNTLARWNGSAVEQVSPVYEYSSDDRMAVVNGKLYFSAKDAAGNHNVEMYSYDGTSVAQVTNRDESNNNFPNTGFFHTTAFDGKVFYIGGDPGASSNVAGYDARWLRSIHASNTVTTEYASGTTAKVDGLWSAGDKLYFSLSRDGQSFKELYRYESTGNATKLSNFTGGQAEFTNVISYSGDVYATTTVGLYRLDPVTDSLEQVAAFPDLAGDEWENTIYSETAVLFDGPMAPMVTNIVNLTAVMPGDTVAAAPAAVVSDIDSDTLASAKVTIGSGRSAGDALSFTPAHGITGTFDASSGILSLSGTANVADYESVLRSVLYTAGSAPGDREIRFDLTDSEGHASWTAAPAAAAKIAVGYAGGSIVSLGFDTAPSEADEVHTDLVEYPDAGLQGIQIGVSSADDTQEFGIIYDDEYQGLRIDSDFVSEPAQLTVKSKNGKEFDMQGFKFQNDAGAPLSDTVVTGFKNGIQTAQKTVYVSMYGPMTLMLLPADFDDVDEVTLELGPKSVDMNGTGISGLLDDVLILNKPAGSASGDAGLSSVLGQSDAVPGAEMAQRPQRPFLGR